MQLPVPPSATLLLFSIFVIEIRCGFETDLETSIESTGRKEDEEVKASMLKIYLQLKSHGKLC